MKRTLALVTATAVLGTGVAIATAAPSTLSFNTSTTSQKATFTSTDDVFQGAKKIGTDLVVCTSTSENSAACKVTLTVAKGTINATFAQRGNQHSGALKVVGGSGAYQGATGTGTYKNLNKTGTKTAVTLKLK